MADLLESGASLEDTLAVTSFRRPLRRYQQLALDAFERQRTEGGKRAYLVLPPGAGKTVLGLEAIRRLGRRALCLCPNTAVQTQWVQQWSDFAPVVTQMGSAPSLDAPLTVLTYQSMCSLDTEQSSVEAHALDLWRRALEQRDGLPPDVAEATVNRLRKGNTALFTDELGHYREQARTLLAQGGSSEELLGLLHRNGLAIVERAKALSPLTLVLDECHHLLELWGYLVRAVIEHLGPDTFVIGLTATPPDQLGQREAELYRSIFGEADFAVATPAVVKEGDLAPYQELAYFVQPLEHEARYIAQQDERFQALVQRLVDPDFASSSLVEWLRQRVVERRTAAGATVGWSTFERDRPALAQAALRFLNQFHLELPRGVRLTERYRQPLTAEDWVALIEDFCLGFLKTSDDPRDHTRAWGEIHDGLPSLGYMLTVRGVRSSVAPVDRVVALSGSKAIATTEILSIERGVLGAELRALVLCDFERVGAEMTASLHGVLDPQAGSAHLVLQTLVSDPAAEELKPTLVTGRTVACSRATMATLCTWIGREAPALRDDLDQAQRAAGAGAWDDVVTLAPANPAWRPSTYVPLLTHAFESGAIQCLIGTRALLGEGWDAQRVNVLVDLTTAGTSVSVHQMRGRTLRLDPKLPRKLADNWGVVCIAPDHPKGGNDYARFVHKHDQYFAPTAEGEIESGVSHVHHALSPFGPPSVGDFPAVNAAMTARAQDRDGAYARWAIGSPYQNIRIETVRLRFGHSLGLPATNLLRHAPDPSKVSHFRRQVMNIASAAVGAGVLGLLAAHTLELDPLLLTGGGAAAAAALGVGLVGRELQTSLARLGPSDTLEDLAAAIVEGLRDAGALRAEVGTDAVRLLLQDDGFYRCYLEHATREESALFAEALDELLAPLAAPRYIIPRYIAPEPPGSAFGALVLAARLAARGRVSERVVYHAVPSYLAANKARVQAFERAWQRHVSAGNALFFQDPRARAILEVQAGENPFEATSQMRTLWQ